MTEAAQAARAAARPGDGGLPDRSSARRGFDLRRTLVWILGLQLGIALILFSTDLARVLPQTLWPSAAPRLTTPVAPGDQTRRYTPRDLPARPAAPGTRPLPPTDGMPARLLFEAAEWEGAASLMLTGQIAPGDAARFAEYLDRQAAQPVTVFLHSPGGSVGDALAIGRTLRDMGVTTRMGGTDICLSACPYMLAAGTERIVAPDAWVGVHQHYFGENTALPAFLAVADIQRGQGEVMAYLDEMDIDPLLMMHALMTPPEEIYLLLPEELERYRMVTQPVSQSLPEAD